MIVGFTIGNGIFFGDEDLLCDFVVMVSRSPVEHARSWVHHNAPYIREGRGDYEAHMLAQTWELMHGIRHRLQFEDAVVEALERRALPMLQFR